MNLPADIIRREIEKNGPISFATFMEIALYAPEQGYYERIRDIGRRGDFFTSVSVGSLFGELLAYQFAEWMSQFPGRREIVEAGAHNGQLAVDILDGLRATRPAILENLEYWIIEPSVSRQAWQQETLKRWASQVRWFKDWGSLPETGVHGVIFSNELLDAMPVQSLSWDADQKCFRERLVAWSNGQFVWETGGVCHATQPTRSEDVEFLPNGFTIEHSPGAIEWWRQAARALRQGKLMAIDYGLTEAEMFQPERGRGTLRSYAAHRASTNVLEHPGEQDITAHVNFSALQRTGEAAGLATHALVSQGKFLTEILQRLWKTMSGSYVWDSQKTRQFQTLTHPEHLGHSFRALIQER